MCGKCGKGGHRVLSALRQCFSNMATECKDDLKSLAFWRGVIMEFFAVIFIVLVGCGSWTTTSDSGVAAGVAVDTTGAAALSKSIERLLLTLRVSLAFGLVYALMLYCVRPISGGHVNPAVSITVTALRRVSVLRGCMYVLAQCLGAIVGAALLLGVTPEAYRGNLGCTVPAVELSDGMAFGSEFLGTFLLVFVVLMVYGQVGDDGRENSAPAFMVGLTVALVSLFLVPYTGGSFNPARSFGPAVVRGVWTSHWVYWFGPVLGALAGGVIYEALFTPKASFGRVRNCLTGFRKSSRDKKNVDEKLAKSESERVALKSSTMASTESLPEVELDDDEKKEKTTTGQLNV